MREQGLKCECGKWHPVDTDNAPASGTVRVTCEECGRHLVGQVYVIVPPFMRGEDREIS